MRDTGSNLRSKLYIFGMDLFDIIKKEQEKSGNMCGISVVKLKLLSGIEVGEIKKQLNKLYSQGKIDVRDGLNGKLIFTK